MLSGSEAQTLTVQTSCGILISKFFFTHKEFLFSKTNPYLTVCPSAITVPWWLVWWFCSFVCACWWSAAQHVKANKKKIKKKLKEK